MEYSMYTYILVCICTYQYILIKLWYIHVYISLYWYISVCTRKCMVRLSTTAYMPVHTLCVNSYTNIPVHTSTYLYIPVYHSICQYKRIWKICITIGFKLTTSCIVSAWLYRFARSINASVFFLSLLWYILWLCTVPGTRRLAAGVGCLAQVPRTSTFLSWVSTTDRPPSCITMLSSKTCYMISTYQYIPVHTVFGLYIQACICTY